MTNMKLWSLRASSLFLLLAASGGLLADAAGILLGQGPLAPLASTAPYVAGGLAIAHGLALLVGVQFWRATPTRFWHLAAAAAHAVLSVCNMIFWQTYFIADFQATGYLVTALHWIFVKIEMGAAVLPARIAGITRAETA